MCLVPNGVEEKVDRENKRGQNDIPVCCILCMCAQVNLSGPYRSVNPQLILPAPPCWLVSPHPPLPDEKIQVPGRGVVVPGGGRGVDRRPCPNSNRSSKPFWISNESLCRKTYSFTLAAQCCAPPEPVSLFDGLPVAVSLALLPELAAAAAGFAAVAAVQGAAGLAHLAAVVQGGTRV